VTDLPTTLGELESLAEKGAIAIVGAFATSAFQAVRDRISGVFGRPGSDPETSVRTRMDEDNALVSRAEDEKRADARRALTPAWQLKLGQLLRDCPEAAQELRDALNAEVPAESQTMVINGGYGGNVYASQGGDVNHLGDVHNHWNVDNQREGGTGLPSPPSAAPEGGDGGRQQPE
jgi:hypothetical protein